MGANFCGFSLEFFFYMWSSNNFKSRALLYIPESRPGMFETSREGDGGVALYCRYWYFILEDWLSMVQVVPLRECPAMVVASTAIRSRSFHLGASHHCCSVPFFKAFTVTACFRVAFILFQVSTTRWGKKFLLLSSLHAWGLRLRESAALWVALPVTVTDLNQVSLLHWSLPFILSSFGSGPPPPHPSPPQWPQDGHRTSPPISLPFFSLCSRERCYLN